MPSEDRRAQILDQLADHVLADGLGRSSLRQLAKAAGTSDRMLLYYFDDKAALISATLELISARITARLAERGAGSPLPFEALRAKLSAIVLEEDMWPFMRLWLEIASLSAGGDPFYRAVGKRLGRGFLLWGASQLDSADEASRAREAAQLLVNIEGMVLLKSLGLDDVLEQAR